jgi:hypothetical protein
MYNGYPQPWRAWLVGLTVAIFALIILQFIVGLGWVIFGLVLALIAIQVGLGYYARRQT